MKIVTSEVMRLIDNATINEGYVEGHVLMERAGRGAAREILTYLEGIHQSFQKSLVILCGKGNNGGDGYVIAKELYECGFSVQIYATCLTEKLDGDALFHARQLPEGIQKFLIDENTQFNQGSILIDCLFGTGLNNDLREPYLGLVHKINASGLPVIAIDIASGLNGTTGELCGAAIIADLTISIGLPKAGHFSEVGASVTGMLVCIDIGFPREIIARFAGVGEAIGGDKDVTSLFVRRLSGVHKYNCGNVSVIGGSAKYMGAVNLASCAAARSGAGMVSCIYPGTGIKTNLQSIISVGLPVSETGNFQNGAVCKVSQYLEKSKAIVFGPGLEEGKAGHSLFAEILKTGQRLVIDAGGLNVLVAFEDEVIKYNNDVVITPHTGELRRLAKGFGICGSDETIARKLAQNLNVVVILKGQFSKVYFPNGFKKINMSGSSKLATAGSGDVLSGIIGAFVAEFENFEQAACAAVYVHGLTADCAFKGVRSVVADDLIECIPKVLQKLSPFA